MAVRMSVIPLLASASSSHSAEVVVGALAVVGFLLLLRASLSGRSARVPAPPEPPRPRATLSAPPPGHRHAGDPRYLVGSDYHMRSRAAANLPRFVRQAQGLDPDYDPADFYPPP